MDPRTAVSMIPVFISGADFITTLTAAMTAVLNTAIRTTIPDPMPGTRVSEMAAAVVVIAAAAAVAEGTDIVLTDFSQTYPSER